MTASRWHRPVIFFKKDICIPITDRELEVDPRASGLGGIHAIGDGKHELLGSFMCLLELQNPRPVLHPVQQPAATKVGISRNHSFPQKSKSSCIDSLRVDVL